MATKQYIPAPLWKSSKCYEIYKRELRLWKSVTKYKSEELAPLVLLNLPDNDELGLKMKIMENITDAELEAADGLETLIKYLDGILLKDELEDVLSKFDDFDDYHRGSDETVNSYILNFDQKYARIKLLGIVLPEQVLAFRLLKRAGLSREEKCLVLTGMNYAEKEQLFSQAKNSLKKMVGDGTSGNAGAFLQSQTNITTPAIKIEPTLFTEGNWRNKGQGSSDANWRYRGNRRQKGYQQNQRPFNAQSGTYFSSNHSQSGRGSNSRNWRGNNRGSYENAGNIGKAAKSN